MYLFNKITFYLSKNRNIILRWADVFALLFLFFIALTVRFTYQSEAIIDGPIRADAREYFFAAYNLYYFNIYSTAPSLPSTDIRPKQDFNRPPGYPLFLLPFIATSNNGDQFIDRVTTAQAIIGSLTVVAAFLLARLSLTLPWAFISGSLTALSPHLVAMDHYILTESLFTFIIVFSTLVVVVSWQKRNLLFSALSGLLFGFSALLRPIALLLGPFLSTIYLIPRKNAPSVSKTFLFFQILCLLLGYAAIYSPYLVYKNSHKTDGFSVSNQPVWKKVIMGADIGLKNFIKAKTDPQLISEMKHMTQDRSYAVKKFREAFLSDPFQYIGWYLGGKALYMWRWNNTYIGDVYQYPMIKKGFHTHPTLHFLHGLMRLLHWPLYFLALASPIVLLLNRYLGRWKPDDMYLIPSLLLFLYFTVLLTIFVPLPRYAIPLRPFIYILAVSAISQVIRYAKFIAKNRPDSPELFQKL